jgi:hypothetical protein
MSAAFALDEDASSGGAVAALLSGSGEIARTIRRATTAGFGGAPAPVKAIELAGMSECFGIVNSRFLLLLSVETRRGSWLGHRSVPDVAFSGGLDCFKWRPPSSAWLLFAGELLMLVCGVFFFTLSGSSTFNLIQVNNRERQ